MQEVVPERRRRRNKGGKDRQAQRKEPQAGRPQLGQHRLFRCLALSSRFSRPISEMGVEASKIGWPRGTGIELEGGGAGEWMKRRKKEAAEPAGVLPGVWHVKQARGEDGV